MTMSEKITYKASGVDIEAGREAVRRLGLTPAPPSGLKSFKTSAPSAGCSCWTGRIGASRCLSRPPTGWERR